MLMYYAFTPDSVFKSVPRSGSGPTWQTGMLYSVIVPLIYVNESIKVKEESEKVGLKLNIQKTKIMASGPITSWEIDGETVETVSDFIFLCSKITADGDCSQEI